MDAPRLKSAPEVSRRRLPSSFNVIARPSDLTRGKAIKPRGRGLSLLIFREAGPSLRARAGEARQPALGGTAKQTCGASWVTCSGDGWPLREKLGWAFSVNCRRPSAHGALSAPCSWPTRAVKEERRRPQDQAPRVLVREITASSSWGGAGVIPVVGGRSTGHMPGGRWFLEGSDDDRQGERLVCASASSSSRLVPGQYLHTRGRCDDSRAGWNEHGHDAVVGCVAPEMIHHIQPNRPPSRRASFEGCCSG